MQQTHCNRVSQYTPVKRNTFQILNTAKTNTEKYDICNRENVITNCTSIEGHFLTSGGPNLLMEETESDLQNLTYRTCWT